MSIAERAREAEGHEPGLGDDTPWQLVFLNLMLVLLALFIAMVSARHFKPKTAVQRVKKVQPKVDSAEVIRARLVRALAALGLKEADVDIYRGQARIVLPANVLFSSGKASLDAEAQRRLSLVATALKRTKNAILVEGHTDDEPIHTRRFSSNWELAAARALAVVRLFIARGVEEKRLELVGYGEFQPRVPNTSADNRRLNRRIEIKLR